MPYHVTKVLHDINIKGLHILPSPIPLEWPCHRELDFKKAIFRTHVTETLSNKFVETNDLLSSVKGVLGVLLLVIMTPQIIPKERPFLSNLLPTNLDRRPICQLGDENAQIVCDAKSQASWSPSSGNKIYTNVLHINYHTREWYDSIAATVLSHCPCEESGQRKIYACIHLTLLKCTLLLSYVSVPIQLVILACLSLVFLLSLKLSISFSSRVIWILVLIFYLFILCTG